MKNGKNINMLSKFIKRLFDLFLALSLFVPAMLVLFVGIVLVKIVSPESSPIFKQERVGYKNRHFTMYKLRSMTNDRDADGNLLPDEVRLKKWGKIVRKTNMDELFQIWNILLGEMSFIGPRPILDFEFEPYKNNPRFCKRYKVLPGMFCTVDVINRAAYREEQMEYDAQYVEQMSLGLDIKTFFGVIAPVLTGRGVYKDEHDKAKK